MAIRSDDSGQRGECLARRASPVFPHDPVNEAILQTTGLRGCAKIRFNRKYPLGNLDARTCGVSARAPAIVADAAVIFRLWEVQRLSRRTISPIDS
jgi:hypothetical protein